MKFVLYLKCFLEFFQTVGDRRKVKVMACSHRHLSPLVAVEKARRLDNQSHQTLWKCLRRSGGYTTPGRETQRFHMHLAAAHWNPLKDNQNVKMGVKSIYWKNEKVLPWWETATQYPEGREYNCYLNLLLKVDEQNWWRWEFFLHHAIQKQTFQGCCLTNCPVVREFWEYPTDASPLHLHLIVIPKYY